MKKTSLKILLLFFLLTNLVFASDGWRSRTFPVTPESVLNPKPLLTGWVIVVDPGHGGKDPGAVNYNLNVYEKDFNLAISLKLKNKLQTVGATVKMTRDNDVSLEIAERRTFTNNANAHRFVSIHINAATPTAEGIETWVDSDANKVWLDYALSLHNNTIKAAQSYDPTIKDRKVKYSGITGPYNDGKKIGVIRYDILKSPAALLELNFISNDKEANRLLRDEYQNRLAEGILEGFLEHAKQYKKEDGLVR